VDKITEKKITEKKIPEERLKNSKNINNLKNEILDLRKFSANSIAGYSIVIIAGAGCHGTDKHCSPSLGSFVGV